MILAWYCLKLLFRDKPKLRVMGLFGCTHKTVAMGVPLITAIYGDHPSVGQYTLPLLIWHPMQLVIGTFLAPRLTAFVGRENERLGITEDEDEEEGDLTAAEEANHDSQQEAEMGKSRFASVFLPVEDEASN